jgi:hypothetical protein
VTKEGRDVSELGARDQVRNLWRTETKKQRVDRILGVPILISLRAKLASLKTFYGWVALVAIVCIHVDECPARHRHQEERSVLRLLLCRTMRSLQELRAEVAPRAACMSCAPGIVASVCVREAQYALGIEAHGAYHPFACGGQAGCVAVETVHLPGQTLCCGRKCADHSKHSVGEPVREVCTDQRCSKSSPGVSDTLGMQLLRLECG